MNKPRITTDSWAMTQSYISPDGEEMWNLSPNEGDWSAVLHLQQSGKMYLTIFRNRTWSKVGQRIVADALKELSEKVYKERGIHTSIGVVVSNSNASLFSTVRQAGFKKNNNARILNSLKVRRRVIIFEYKPCRRGEL